MSILSPQKSVNQEIILPEIQARNIRLFIKREDLLHKHISGNKYRKLFYNLIEAKRQKKQVLLTFGGAFSNHIAATAAAGREFGFRTIGVIRGEELGKNLTETLSGNPTLAFATKQGMQLFFIDRKTYREKKEKESFIERLRKKFGDFYLVPQGGTNVLAVRGAEEILTEKDKDFDFITSAVGTGGTIAGLIRSSKAHQQVLGFPALKENFLHEEIKKFTKQKNWHLIRDYHFGGFAKINEELVAFINDFYERTGIALDPVYTGKMFYGIFRLIEKEFFPSGSMILAIHTGGLQGIDAMNLVLRKKNLPVLRLPSFY